MSAPIYQHIDIRLNPEVLPELPFKDSIWSGVIVPLRNTKVVRAYIEGEELRSQQAYEKMVTVSNPLSDWENLGTKRGEKELSYFILADSGSSGKCLIPNCSEWNHSEPAV